MQDKNQYAIRGGEEGNARLHLLHRILRSTTVRLLQKAGLEKGMTCLDVGCGGGVVTLEMARVVGPDGTAVGIDMDTVALELARQDAVDQGVSNVVFSEADVTQLSEHEAFDFIFARFLLTHLPHPEQMVTRMVAALRAGGALAVEDIDFRGHFAHPSCPALDKYAELYQQVVRRKGADPIIGPRLYGLLLDAGLGEVDISLVHPVHTKGEGKHIHPMTLEAIASSVIDEGLATPSELEELLEDLNRGVRDARTLMGMPRIFQVWGVKS